MPSRWFLPLPGALTVRLGMLLCFLVLFNAIGFRALYVHHLRTSIAPNMAQSIAAMVDDIRASLEMIPAAQRQAWIDRFNTHRSVTLELMPAGAGAPDYPALNVFQTILLTNLQHLDGSRLRIGVAYRPERVLLVEFDAIGQRYRLGMPGVAIESDSIWPIAWWIFSNLLIIFLGVTFTLRQVHEPLQRGAAALQRSANSLAEIEMPDSAPSEFRLFAQRFNALAVRLREQERERALLLAGVSHDLRAPLTRIRLHAELLDEDGETTGKRIMLDTDSIRHIIDQFLDYQRSNNPQLMTTVNLRAAVVRAVSCYRALGRRIELLANEDVTIVADPTAVERILSNVIDNALGHGAEPVECTLSTDGDRALLRVRDHGNGIKTSDIERLLKPFERADDARSRQGHCGLGLSIIHRLVRELRGALKLSNHTDGGLVVEIWFPLQAVP